MKTTLKFAPALMLAALLTGGTARANYRAKAETQTDWIQSKFFDKKAGLYRPTYPAPTDGLPYEVMWGNGVQLTALVGATRYDPAKYKPILYAFTKSLNKYWDTAAPVPGFDAWFSSPDNDDKYYDDNAWLTLGFTEAYRVTKDANYLDWAKKVHHFVLSGLDDKLGGGIYWYQNKKDSKNTCINAPAAVGALALYDLGDKSQLAQAQQLVTWTNAKLQDPSDGLFWDNIKLDGKVEKTKWTYNTALMIRANVGLWRDTKNPKYLADARREGDASLAYFVDPATGGFKDGAKFNHLLSESLIDLYAATRDIKYLNAVRRDADFGYRYVRDASGGYWDEWKNKPHTAGEKKAMIENASVARLYWLLVPYPDIEELTAQAKAADAAKNWQKASGLWRQVVESTSG